MRICKYGCKAQLEIDKIQNKYIESDGKNLHTRERCESLKQKDQQGNHKNNKGNSNDISVQFLLKRLEQIGITINLEKLRNIWPFFAGHAVKIIQMKIYAITIPKSINGALGAAGIFMSRTKIHLDQWRI